ncbi:MAG TPA: hypothetical protein VF444_02660 [Pseudonocardiaceae bacterium]
MHLHAYVAPGVRAANIPPRPERTDWEPDDVFTETAAAVEWLASATRKLCGDDLDLSDETPLWTKILDAGDSVHGGAKDTSLLVESEPDCECDQDQAARIAPLRRGRRR